MRAAFATSSLSGRMRIGTLNLAWSPMVPFASLRSVLVGNDRNTGPHGDRLDGRLVHQHPRARR
jgi:hypothetical protein